MRKNLFFCVTLAMLICSCKNYKIATELLAWNPYKVGDKLVFKSSNGTTQTLYVVKVDKTKSKENPYAGIFSGTFEQLAVTYNTNPEGNANTDRLLFALGRSGGGDKFVNFLFQMENAYFPTNPYDITILEQWTEETKTINGKTYVDILALPRVDTNSGANIRIIEKAYWSKSKGYVRFDFSSGEIWELQ